MAVHERCSEDELLTVGCIAERRLRVVGDDLRDGVERVLTDVVLAVGRQCDGHVVHTVWTQHRQRVRTTRLQTASHTPLGALMFC